MAGNIFSILFGHLEEASTLIHRPAEYFLQASGKVSEALVSIGYLNLV